MEPVTKKYVVVVEDVIGHVKGDILDMEPEAENTKDLLEKGQIAPLLSDDELEDYVVTEAFLAENPEMAAAGVVVGETIRMPKQDVLEEEEVETIPETEPVVEAEVEAEVAAAADGPTLTYNGKTVISESIRTVNDRDLHHVRLEDGSECDISDEEHAAMLAAASVTA